MNITENKMDSSKWYTVEELKELYQVSERTLRNWRQKGLLERSSKFGNVPLKYRLAVGHEVTHTGPIENLGMSSVVLLDTMNAIPNDQMHVHTEGMKVPDVTDVVEKKGGVRAFLEALTYAESKVTTVDDPINLSQTRSFDVRKKILVMSDLHCPFQHDDLIERIWDEHKDADILVLNGDIIDAYGASSFPQEKLVTILEEYNAAMELLIRASKLFPSVLLVRGNHDERIDRYFSRKFDPHMYAMAQKDILWRLANGFIYDAKGNHVGTYKFDNVVYNPQGMPWVAQIGKTIFMHPSSYSGKPMSTVSAALDHIQNFVEWNTFDSIIIGHTHKIGRIIERNKLLLEQGCLTRLMDYQKSGKFSRRPTTLGYALIYQDHQGNTDFNLSNVIYCGSINHMQ